MKSGDNECIMYRLVPNNIPEKKELHFPSE